MAELQLSTLLVLSLMLTSVYSNEAAQRETNQIESRVGLFDIIASAFTTNGLDTAPYNVLRTAEGYEERLYPAQKWVKTQVNDISKDAATSPMFQKLFAFISGQNDKGVQVPMTSPVTTYIQPGAGPNCESTFTMAFYIPPTFQENPPKPTDETVSIEERPEIRVFARAFQGPADETSFVQQARLFGEMIMSGGDAEGVNFDYYFSVQSSSGNHTEHIEEIWFLKSDS
jgi:hypothetical protein